MTDALLVASLVLLTALLVLQLRPRASADVRPLLDHLERLREAVRVEMAANRAESAAALAEMRATVDEKLQGTLERRLDESFSAISRRLVEVHHGLGEMRALAAGVGDLKKVLSSVRARGVLGEIQLAALLEQVLAPDQYATNVAVTPAHAGRVEFAVRLPGRDGPGGPPVWLPIDAKFPADSYARLSDAAEAGDAATVQECARELEGRVRACAREIRSKYVDPPHTTSFAILFLPFEGLYAEVLRRPGLVESVQREHQVTIAGPTTLAALLNSLQMGFQTLAIQHRSNEVWNVLSAFRAQFARFADLLALLQRRLTSAHEVVERAASRTRAIDQTLRSVGALPPGPPASDDLFDPRRPGNSE